MHSSNCAFFRLPAMAASSSSSKRSSSSSPPPSSSSPKKKAKLSPDHSSPPLTNPNRARLLKSASLHPHSGAPVIYWMSRDQRSRDNWALLYAADLARQQGSSFAVAFNLVDSFLNAQARQFAFLVRGLRVLEWNLSSLDIPFFFFRGKPEENIPALLKKCKASTLVVDFSPLRICRKWREDVCRRVPPSVTVYEVDAHNIVPAWVSSDKLEYSARTIRTKIQKHLPDYLVEFPTLEASRKAWTFQKPHAIDWDSVLEDVTRKGSQVPEVQWCVPGEDAAMEALMGKKNGFLTTRIRNYADDRNDPSKPSGISGLSPYLHFGQISAQRCALESQKLRKSNPKAVDAFLEELIIRRELADNFCLYQPHYDSLQGAYEWARSTLLAHAADERDHIYSKEQLEKATTHDELWNASQLEMVYLGKMHGFMRMYWAKKILEWTTAPEEALAIAIYLNDKYELDGRDPNGYVGCMWSICGIHDQGWKERPVFGKIRYMNYNGCKRKFNVDGYISYVRKAVSELKNARKFAQKTPLSKSLHFRK